MKKKIDSLKKLKENEWLRKRNEFPEKEIHGKEMETVSLVK